MEQFQQNLKQQSAKWSKENAFVPRAGQSGLENIGQGGRANKVSRAAAAPDSNDLVRQPDKEGVERFVDVAYSQKLSAIEQQFEQLMAERMAASKDKLYPQEEDEHGNKRAWYQAQFYQDMTTFYMSPDRVRMKTKPGAKLRSNNSKMGSFNISAMNESMSN